jgi:hypothetical protein
MQVVIRHDCFDVPGVVVVQFGGDDGSISFLRSICPSPLAAAAIKTELCCNNFFPCSLIEHGQWNVATNDDAAAAAATNSRGARGKTVRPSLI